MIITDVKITSQNLKLDMNKILPEESNRIKDISKSNNNSVINKIKNSKNSIKINNVNNNINALNIKQQLSISLLNKL